MRRTEQRPHYTMVDEERGKEKEVCERNEENGGWAVKKCGVGDRIRSEDDGE